MQNVPSSAVILIAGTIISLICITVFVRSYDRYKTISYSSRNAVSQMDISAKPDEFSRYVGSVIEGDKLRSLLDSCDGRYIAVYVSNGTDTVLYDYRTGRFGNDTLGWWTDYYNGVMEDGSRTTVAPNTMVKDYKSSNWYIDPLDTYACEGYYADGVISYLRFVRQ